MLQVLEVSRWGMKAVSRINIIPDVPTEHLGRSQPRRMSASQHLLPYMFGLKVPQLTFRVNHLFFGLPIHRHNQTMAHDKLSKKRKCPS